MRDAELVLVPPAEKPKAKGYQALSPDAIRAGLEAQGKATPLQIESILWLHAHGVEQSVGSLTALGKLIGYGDAVLSQVFAGKYPGDLAAVANAIESYRPVWASRQTLGGEPLLPTLAPAAAIAAFAGQVRSSATIGVVWGRSHVGKTSAIKLYAQQHPDTTTLVTMPPGGSALKFLKALAAIMRVSRKKGETLEEAIMSGLSPQHLLIVDQMHRTILGQRMQMATIDLLVEFHDQTGCGIILVGTPTFVESMQDARNALFMEQIENRGALRLQLPAELPLSDGIKLGMAYGLPKPGPEEKAILKDLLKKHRVGLITKYFRLARSAAVSDGEPFSWQHVDDMRATLADWSQGIGVYEEGGAA